MVADVDFSAKGCLDNDMLLDVELVDDNDNDNDDDDDVDVHWCLLCSCSARWLQ